MKPTIGQIVHVQRRQDVWLAAIVTHIADDVFTTTVFDEKGTDIGVVCRFDREGHHWRWPPRVEPAKGFER